MVISACAETQNQRELLAAGTLQFSLAVSRCCLIWDFSTQTGTLIILISFLKDFTVLQYLEACYVCMFRFTIKSSSGHTSIGDGNYVVYYQASNEASDKLKTDLAAERKAKAALEEEMTSVKSELQQQTSQLAESKSALATYEEQLVELKTNLASAEARLVSQTMGNESANEKVCRTTACFTITYVNIDVQEDMAPTTHSYSYGIYCYQ